MDFNVGAVTDTGQKRSQNQDHYICVPEAGFFLVADGMGGHQGGATASRMATEKTTELIQKTHQAQPPTTPASRLTEAIRLANTTIYDLSNSQTELKGMGTTITAILFSENQLWIGQVGDSRCYLIRNEGCWQITRDHSMVEEKFRAGLISRESMKSDQMRNVITRSVGYEPKVNPEIFFLDVKPGDIFMICSDGLSGLVEDSEIFRIISTGVSQQKSFQEIAQALVSEANRKGGDDNITSVVVQKA